MQVSFDDSTATHVVQHLDPKIWHKLVADAVRVDEQVQLKLLYQSSIAAHNWDSFAAAVNAPLGTEKFKRSGGILHTYRTLQSR